MTDFKTTQRTLLRVAPGQIYRMTGAKGVTIHVHSGVLWITESNVPDDHFPSNEQTYRIRTQGTVLIEPANTNAIEFKLRRPLYPLVYRLAYCVARGVTPLTRLKAR